MRARPNNLYQWLCSNKCCSS